jgi:Fungal specific transcription factor domain
MRAKLCPTVRLSLLLMNSLSDVLPSNFESKDSAASATSNSVFSSQIRHIIERDGKYIDDVVVRYFQGVHLWLPIISKKRFRDRFAHFQATPTADFALLLLLMRLIIQHPSPDPDMDQDREVLYLASKTLFAQVQAFVPSSLFLVQAGVMLATYEHAHGMIEAAYVTIGTSARMACALGLHTKPCSMEMQGTDAWLDDEEALATWWGLMICDRYVDRRWLQKTAVPNILKGYWV